jgi:hypothetical protein
MDHTLCFFFTRVLIISLRPVPSFCSVPRGWLAGFHTTKVIKTTVALEVKIIWGDAYIEAAVQLSLSACLSLFALLRGKLKGTQRGSQTAGPLVWLTAWSEPASLSTTGSLSRIGSGVCLCHLSGSCRCP